jgi:hypothetical protein
MRCAHDNHVHGGKRSDIYTSSCTTRYSNNQTCGYLVNDWHDFNQSINQCYICSNEIHREFMPAIHQKSLIWLILTFSSSPSKTTIQIAIDSNLDTHIYSYSGLQDSSVISLLHMQQ